MADFPGCGDRSYLINLVYNGFVAQRLQPGGDWKLTYDWFLKVPAGETTPTTGTVNKGRLQFPTAPHPWSIAWRSVALSYGSPDTFTVNDNGTTVNMERYAVSYNFTVTNGEYCDLESFQTYFKIASDCSEYPVNSLTSNPSYKTGQLTPQTYDVYTWGASPNNANPSLNRFDIYPLIPPPPCHTPALGASPEHIVYNRKQGTSTWQSQTFTSLTTQTIDVTSTGAGTYEY